MTFPLWAPSRIARLALLALLSVLLTDTASSAARRVTCPNETYVLVLGAEVVADDAGVPPLLQVADGDATVARGCPLTKGRAKPTRFGVKVSGKFRDCGGHKKLKLKALIPPTCDGVAGVIRGRGFTPAAIVGVASSCGDGVVDTDLGEQCDAGVACADSSPCDGTCRCGGGGGTTSTTIASSNVTVAITSAFCTADACSCPGSLPGLDYHLKAAGTVSGPTGTQIRINVNAGQGGQIDCGEWTPIDASVNPSCDVIKCCQRNSGQPETANWQALEAIDFPCFCPSSPIPLLHNYLAQAQFSSEPAVEDEETTTPCP
jgi:hypothetical protein